MATRNFLRSQAYLVYLVATSFDLSFCAELCFADSKGQDMLHLLLILALFDLILHRPVDRFFFSEKDQRHKNSANLHELSIFSEIQ